MCESESGTQRPWTVERVREEYDTAVASGEDCGFGPEHVGTLFRALDAWKNRAEQCWDLLDDVSTLNDAAKSDDSLFRRLVENRVELRSRLAQSEDGYTLTWKTPVPSPVTDVLPADSKELKT